MVSAGRVFFFMNSSFDCTKVGYPCFHSETGLYRRISLQSSKKSIVKRSITTFIFFLALLSFGYGQSPDSFNYQAVVRDAGGQVMPNQNVALRLSILENSPNGTPVYTETHTATTNAFGLVNLRVGDGTVQGGTFSAINWGGNSHFLRVELDPAGGASFQTMGVQQLVSVPYALNARSVENDAVDDADADPSNEIQILSISGDSLFLTSGGSVQLPTAVDTDDQTLSISNDSLIIADGNSVDLSPYLDDTDTDDQTLSISNDSLVIADGNSVDLSPYLDDTDTDDQTLSIASDSLFISDGNAVDLSPYLVDTDDQDLSLSNDSILIADGAGVDISAYLDNTDDQQLSISNDSLFISDGNSVDLSPYLDDTDTDTDDQDLSISNDSLLIADGSGVDLSPYLDNTDEQTLSISNDSLIISDGNSVDLSAYVSGIPSYLADDDDDTKIEVEKNADEDIIRFKTGGLEHFRMQSGRLEVFNNESSVFMGEGAGANVTSSAAENTYLGYQAGYNCIDATLSIAIGYKALYANTSNSFNVAIGGVCLENNTGQRNTAVGYSCYNDNTTGSYNTGMGMFAANYNTTGSNNVSLGNWAGLYNETGSNNVFVGRSAGAGTSGYSVSENVCLGREAGGSLQGDGNIFIGYKAGGAETGSDKLYIDNSNTSTPLIYGEFDNNFLAFNGDLGIGIGSVAPSYKLEVGVSGDNTEARANAWNTFSDRRWKTDFEVITDAIAKVEAVNGYYYKWKDKPDTTMQVGIIAQEIEAILPEIVSTDKAGYKSVDYSKLTALLIQAVKEQQDQIESQSLKIEAQASDMRQFRSELDEIKASIGQQTGGDYAEKK